MCKAGQIQEAYNIAINDWEADPANVWTQREVGWAIYYKMKAFAEAGDYDHLLQHLEQLRSLEKLTVEEDSMIFENVVRSFGGYFKSNAFLSNNDPMPKLSAVMQKLQEHGFDEQHIQQQAGWALYYLIKADADAGKYDALVTHLNKLKSLDQLTMEQDSMIFDNMLFAVCKYIKNNVFLNDPSSPSRLSEIFNQLKDYQFNPSRGYSYLLQNHLKFVDFWNEIADFFEWWNLDNLTQEDYTPFENQKGQKMMTLAERAFIANSKALLKLKDLGRIEEFLPKLDTLMSIHPEMTYPGYFYGKLLLSLGDNEEEALKVVIPFARKKSTEFWVWQLLSDVFAHDQEKQLACLLRAVDCKTKETFLGKVRIKLADYYVRNQQYDKARFHIDKVTRCYVEQGWKLPNEINYWMHEPWLNTTIPNGDTGMDYKAITDAILCEGTEEAIAIVTYFDQQSKRVSMIYGWQKRLSQKLRIKVGPGAVLKINYILEADGKPKVLNAVKGTFSNNLQFAKVVQGTISKRDDKLFAFLKTGTQDYFISPATVQKYHITNGDVVKALAVYDFDRKKETWNWICISINK